MVLVYSNGQMGDSMKVIGLLENNTVKVNIRMKKVRLEKGNGKMVRF